MRGAGGTAAGRPELQRSPEQPGAPLACWADWSRRAGGSRPKKTGNPSEMANNLQP